MNSLYRILMAGAAATLFAANADAQADIGQCSAIAAPAARLACYDQLSGHGKPRPSAPVTAPTAAPAPRAAVPVSTDAALRKRNNFNAVAQEIEPLPHGLFRLHLADGTAYDTSMEGAHIARGAALHIRRSPLGTTFVDLPGQAPIPVRLFRQQ